MSHNDTGSDYEDHFPEEAPARRFMSVRVVAILLLLVAGAFGGTYYYGYQRGLEDGRHSLPPVVLADRAPIKIPASQLPDKASKESPNLNIYDVARGKADTAANAPAEVVKSAPADNASGAVESLIDAPAEKPAPVEAKEKPAPAPPLAKKPPEKKEKKASAVVKAQNFYMVQIFASRNRTDARSTYRRLQTKYSNLLTGREPLILRADLGGKGIYFRANVPGFASKAKAAQFCAQLKKQGQDCLVRKQPQS